MQLRWELVLGREELCAMDIAWLHLPVPDYTAPDLRSIKEGVRFIAEQVRRCTVCMYVCMYVCM